MYLDFVMLIRNDFVTAKKQIVRKSRLREVTSAGKLAG